jgi:hypothetical protein
MSNEINEFLRKAAQRRAQQAAQAAQQREQAEQQQQTPQLRPTEPTRRLTDRLDSISNERGIEAEVVNAEIAPTRSLNTRLEQQVAKDLDTSGFSQRADRMGDVVEQSDDRLESHLHAKFDHKLGNISAPTKATTTDISTEAFESRAIAVHPLMQLLNSPENVRNAVILSDIFKRPEW